eukprot:TRINITY_DN126_c0_g1_i1.p1 TRINITY_DN126_c0_g1~~TRINITY_DN126_c0_g1_i1.p1  ORF type:complete len:236 (-),score=45.53 TRINITY_DN126_c0_g1_i1:1702-2409(-)
MANNWQRKISEPYARSETLSQGSRPRSFGAVEAPSDDADEAGEEFMWEMDDVESQNVDPEKETALDLPATRESETLSDPPATSETDEGLRTLSGRPRFGMDMEKGRGLGIVSSSSQWGPVGRTTASRNIPLAQSGTEHVPKRPLVQSSAPVNIVDWRLILGERDKKAPVRREEEEEDEDSEAMVPPHMMIQRQSMRENHGFAMSFSVREGAGRTLKGRDQTRVRNTVLRQTGFLD